MPRQPRAWAAISALGTDMPGAGNWTVASQALLSQLMGRQLAEHDIGMGFQDAIETSTC